MKTAIIYYSHSGNTGQVAEVLKNYLSQKGAVDVIELKALDEADGFFGQCARAFNRKKATIQVVNFNLSGYDLICIGTPVWAFGPAPAVNTYIDNCQGIAGKQIVLFSTYGSGAGNKRCIDYIQDILTQKGANAFKRFSVQQSKCADKEFVQSQITQSLAL